MSNLRYKSASELRDIINRCQKQREANKEKWELKEKLAENLLSEARALRSMDNNIAQKEVWARIYLARIEE